MPYWLFLVTKISVYIRTVVLFRFSEELYCLKSLDKTKKSVDYLYITLLF